MLAGYPLFATALGVEEGTLSGAILMSYRGGALVDQVTNLAPGQDLLARMEQGDYEATLIELHRFDAYVAEHPDTELSSSGHYHSLGHNAGFVGLASDAALLADVNAALDAMLAEGALRSLASTAGLTYLPPRRPEILPTISHVQLLGD